MYAIRSYYAPYQDELNLALARQEQAAANLAKLEAGSRPQEIVQAEALVRERQTTVNNLAIEYRRMQSLVESGAVARQAFDNADAALKEAEARLETAQEGLKLAREGFRIEDVNAARADLRRITSYNVCYTKLLRCC